MFFRGMHKVCNLPVRSCGVPIINESGVICAGLVAFHFRNMSIADFACVVHFHLGKESQPGSPSGDFLLEQEVGQNATSLVIKILELSTGSILSPSFEFELTSQSNSGTIHEALENADQFIEDNFRSQGRRFAVIMDTSSLDEVIAECERQDASIPMFFSFAHDVIAAAKSVHPFESNGLRDAMSACGIPLSDAPQQAACVHIARLCQFAVNHGFRFPAAIIRKVTAKKVNKRAATHTEDVASKAHAPDSKSPSNAPASQVSDASSFATTAMLPISQYCRFRGLPYSATKADIIAFCEDIPVDEQNVHILLGPGGRPTGDAMCAISRCTLTSLLFFLGHSSQFICQVDVRLKIRCGSCHQAQQEEHGQPIRSGLRDVAARLAQRYTGTCPSRYCSCLRYCHVPCRQAKRAAVLSPPG
jgi:hypothetical protein